MSLQKATIGLVVLAVLAGAAIYFYSRPAGQDVEVPVDAMAPDGPQTERVPATPEPEPEFVEPALPDEEPAEPLPPLESSDPAVRETAAEVTSERFVEDYLVPDSVVRKLVATVDNLPREKIDMRVRAVPSLGGRFLVSGPEDEGDEILLSAENFDRYDPFVDVITTVDPATAVDLYIRFYPLLQEAYVDLGYPSRQLHNRLLEVIDHLLATPEVQMPIRLVRPHVLYKYADPDLEALSAGQKALVRTGPEHMAALKDALRAFRVELQARTLPESE